VFTASSPDFTNPDGSNYTSDPSQVIATGSDSVLGAQFASMASYMKSTYNPGDWVGDSRSHFGAAHHRPITDAIAPRDDPPHLIA
jgi:hypothetical protein